MRTIASATATRSLAGRCDHTCGLLTFGMVGPPGYGYSLEGRNQFGNGSRGQNGRFRAGLCGQIGATDRNVGELIGEKLDLAMADVSGQIGDSSQLQDSAEQRMTRIGNGDLTLAYLRNQRGITLAGFCPGRSDPRR
jgi:hypothetical protein